MKTRYIEILFGISIIIITFLFIFYSLLSTNYLFNKHYSVKAIFNNIGPLNVGAKIKINGYLVGKVSEIKLNNDNYNVIVILDINSDILIPKDSTLELFSGGIFDGIEIKIIPGKEKEYLINNDVFIKTSDYISLEDKIGNIFLKIGG